jgi:hypothetical protein
MESLQKKLTEILQRFITDKDLEGKTDKQLWYLKALVENIINPNKGAFYYKPKNESLKIIKDILGIREYLDKKQAFIKTKFN